MNTEANSREENPSESPFSLKTEDVELAELIASLPVCLAQDDTCKSISASIGAIDQSKSDTLFRVLEYIFELDQADPSHSRGAELYQKLKQLEAHFVGTEAENHYFYLLGFLSFHAGQTIALSGGKTEDVIALLKTSEGHTSAIPEFTDWHKYVHATRLYFESDARNLRKAVREFPKEDDNFYVLKNLLKGLDDYGRPNYNRDYRR